MNRPRLSLPHRLLPGGNASVAPVSTARPARGFTLLEILLALALVSMIMIAMNTFVFSMGELWGKNTDSRLFERHARAVTRFLDHTLREASLPPAAVANSTPVGILEVKPQSGAPDKLLTFELLGGSRLFVWPDRPLPEVVCSLQLRQNDGLYLLWHSRLEKDFDTDPARETLVTPLVTAMSYDYYDPQTNRWTNESLFKLDGQGNPMVPQRLRLKFSYLNMTRETVIALTTVGRALPNF